MDEPILEEEPGDQPLRGSSRHASTALFAGVIALISSVAVVGGLIGVAALVLGVKALRRMRASNGRLRGKSMAITGIVLGALAIPVALLAMGFSLLFPALLRYRREAEVAGTVNHMRIILDGCRQYAADDNDFLPPSLAPVVSLYSLPTGALRDVRNTAPPMTQPAVDPDYGKYEAAVAAHCDFIYTGAGLRLTAAGLDRIMILFAKAPASGHRLIGFADGHVENLAPEEWPPVLQATNQALIARHHPPLPDTLLHLPSP
jgi:hypothetical protein